MKGSWEDIQDGSALTYKIMKTNWKPSLDVSSWWGLCSWRVHDSKNGGKTEIEKGFDKDDLYMTGFKMTFDYDGDAGMVDMDIKTDFSDWNQVDDTEFEAPKDMTI